jgi:hypothetical protein
VHDAGMPLKRWPKTDILSQDPMSKRLILCRASPSAGASTKSEKDSKVESLGKIKLLNCPMFWSRVRELGELCSLYNSSVFALYSDGVDDEMTWMCRVTLLTLLSVSVAFTLLSINL